jgi:hypothetical protein
LSVIIGVEGVIVSFLKDIAVEMKRNYLFQVETVKEMQLKKSRAGLIIVRFDG